MKKTYAFALMSGLLMLGSCASDAPEAPVKYEPIDAEGNIGYIAINIANSDTRAGDENAIDGKNNIDESSIKHIDLLFNDMDGKPFPNPIRVEANKIDKATNTAVVKLPKMPKEVAVVVNGEGNYSDLTHLATHTVSRYSNSANTATEGRNKNFYMSSSKYWDSKNNFAPTYVTPISADQVMKSEAEAKTATPVSVTVERYVARIFVNSTLENTINPLDKKADPADETKNLYDHSRDVVTGDGTDANAPSAVVTFEPKYVFLTAYNNQAYRIKNVPTKSTMETLNLWPWANDEDAFRSKWVGETAGTVNFATLKQLKGNTAAWSKAWGAFDATKDVFYPFENRQDQKVYKTAVVVAGEYTVTDSDGNTLAADDGTFYLIAFGDRFTVCKTEAEAVKAMGGDAATDKLVPEGPNDSYIDPATEATDAKWTGWTGWMKIKDRKDEAGVEHEVSPVRCVKYTGGYGYYAQEINRYTLANGTQMHAIVRNHLYNVNINGIAGMGVGIPSEDQPIINIDNPDPKKQQYYLNMSVTIAPWRVVTTPNEIEWK